jgi:hypothetical protein
VKRKAPETAFGSDDLETLKRAEPAAEEGGGMSHIPDRPLMVVAAPGNDVCREPHDNGDKASNSEDEGLRQEGEPPERRTQTRKGPDKDVKPKESPE